MTETPLARVEFDDRGPRTTYEEFIVGDSLGSLEWTVTREAVDGLLVNDQDWHEWYESDSPAGYPVVPPMATYPPVRMLFTRRFNVRGVFYQFRGEFVRPIRYGERLRITGTVHDKYIKRNREFVTYEAIGVDDDDQVVFRTWRTHALDYITRDKPRSGKGVDSGLLSS
ncbi:MAG TPA: hypothetical protein VFX16_21985 [Pseudonocardiaceae bacterium]|nr:hypothetical protein [Pseudonocardiaceae bacterium]